MLRTLTLILIAYTALPVARADSYLEPTNGAVIAKVRQVNRTMADNDHLGLEFQVAVEYLLPARGGIFEADPLSDIVRDYVKNFHRLPSDPRAESQNLKSALTFPKGALSAWVASDDIALMFDDQIWIFDPQGKPLQVFINSESAFSYASIVVGGTHSRSAECEADMCDEALMALDQDLFALAANEEYEADHPLIQSLRVLRSASLSGGTKEFGFTARFRSSTENGGPFNDVPFDHPYAESIIFAKEQGIVTGYDDGTFKPDSPVNRAELVKMIVEATQDNAQVEACASIQSTVTLYRDLNPNAWYNPYLCAAKLRKIISGYPDGTFGPERFVNIAEASKIMTLAFDLPVTKASSEEWFLPFYRSVTSAGAMPPSIRTYDHILTRAEWAYALEKLSRN